MFDFEFEAVVYAGHVFCVECLPHGVSVGDEEVTPIFAGSEQEGPILCDNCGAEHDYMSIIDEEE